MKTKICKKCGKRRLIKYFNKNTKLKCGYASDCYFCEKSRLADSYKRNIKKIKERGQLYRDENKKLILYRAKKAYHKRRKNNICKNCPARTNKQLCTKCSKRSLNLAKSVRLNLIKNGFCVTCNKKRENLKITTCERCRRKNLKKLKIKHTELRLKIIKGYGSKCSCCGIDETQLLTIDHINNDGKQQRNKIGAGVRFFNWIIKNNFPNSLRLLCHNCNSATYRFGKCPHKRKINIDCKSLYNRNKTKVFNHYGNKCNYCSENDICFLSIDHINDDGATHRKQVTAIYNWLIRNNFPSGFQTLCFNCNFEKYLKTIK